MYSKFEMDFSLSNSHLAEVNYSILFYSGFTVTSIEGLQYSLLALKVLLYVLYSTIEQQADGDGKSIYFQRFVHTSTV